MGEQQYSQLNQNLLESESRQILNSIPAGLDSYAESILKMADPSILVSKNRTNVKNFAERFLL